MYLVPKEIGTGFFGRFGGRKEMAQVQKQHALPGRARARIARKTHPSARGHPQMCRFPVFK
jgi:hypothetical protein